MATQVQAVEVAADLAAYSQESQEFLAHICEVMRHLDELDELAHELEEFVQSNHCRLGIQPKTSVGYLPQKEPGPKPVEGGPDEDDLDFFDKLGGGL